MDLDAMDLDAMDIDPMDIDAMDLDAERLRPDGEGIAEQAALIAEEAKAQAKLMILEKADEIFWQRYRDFWRYLAMEVDPEQAKVGPKQTEDDPEQLKADEVALAERAAAHAEETKADAEELRKRKEFWSYLIIFFLHFHDCSVQTISSVFDFFGIEGTKGGIASCIEENQLRTHKQALPDDDHEWSAFRFDTIPELFVQRIRNRPYNYQRLELRGTPDYIIVRIHPTFFRFTINHPQLPAVGSAARVCIRDREDRRLVIEASRKQIVITSIGFREFHALELLYSHYRRCMLRAVGTDISPRNTLNFSDRGVSFS